MRILIVSALLVATASCVLPPPPQAAVAGPPPVVAAPAPFVLAPLAWLFAPLGPPGPPPPGRLTLNNFSFDHARVQALITSYPDCAVHEGTVPNDFVLPLNSTWVIEAAPGTDVCWRREIATGTTQGVAPTTPGWTEWNRVFLSSAGVVDSRL